MDFKNIKKFEEFIKKNAKNYLGNVQDYLNDLEKQYGNSGLSSYELGRSETKSGNPELYSFEVIETYDKDHDCTEISCIL